MFEPPCSHLLGLIESARLHPRRYAAQAAGTRNEICQSTRNEAAIASTNIRLTHPRLWTCANRFAYQTEAKGPLGQKSLRKHVRKLVEAAHSRARILRIIAFMSTEVLCRIFFAAALPELGPLA